MALQCFTINFQLFIYMPNSVYFLHVFLRLFSCNTLFLHIHKYMCSIIHEIMTKKDPRGLADGLTVFFYNVSSYWYLFLIFIFNSLQ